MFYIASKLFWLVVQPLNLAVILILATLILSALRWRKSGLGAAAAAFLIVAVPAWTSTGALMLHPLESRFSRPAEAPRMVAGIVVLGGGLEGGVNQARGGYEMNSGGDRLVETAILARRYPAAKILISGGTGTLFLTGEGDADTAPRLLGALGVDRERLLLENKSRNTHENAVLSRRMADLRPGETWLLVTSAFHMPRAMGLFRAEGFDVIAWPTDYRTSGEETFALTQDNPLDSLENFTTAQREWIGLFAYWLTGRIETLLPAPA